MGPLATCFMPPSSLSFRSLFRRRSLPLLSLPLLSLPLLPLSSLLCRRLLFLLFFSFLCFCGGSNGAVVGRGAGVQESEGPAERWESTARNV